MLAALAHRVVGYYFVVAGFFLLYKVVVNPVDTEVINLQWLLEASQALYVGVVERHVVADN